MSKSIEFIIDIEGNVKFELHGFSGKNCEQVADEIARLLGDTKSKERTTEYYNNQQISGGQF